VWLRADHGQQLEFVWSGSWLAAGRYAMTLTMLPSSKSAAQRREIDDGQLPGAATSTPGSASTLLS
jgi:hypothetical protein